MFRGSEDKVILGDSQGSLPVINPFVKYRSIAGIQEIIHALAVWFLTMLGFCLFLQVLNLYYPLVGGGHFSLPLFHFSLPLFFTIKGNRNFLTQVVNYYYHCLFFQSVYRALSLTISFCTTDYPFAHRASQF